jgi:S1-C subfamily serine protease
MKAGAAFLTLAAIVGVWPALGQSIDAFVPRKPRAMAEPAAPLGKNGTGAQPNFAAENLLDLPADLPTARLSEIARQPLAEATAQTRSAKDAQIYRAVSPLVVLIATKEALGSGSLIGPGEVLTNLHVVAGYSDVAVVFKPPREGDPPTKNDMLTGRVVKHDEVADLALVKFASPPGGEQVLRLGDSSEIGVGLDVHAVGHPTGQTWTYTKGVISQYRLGHEWQGSDGIKHKADVIQTQTPINPGNSGGPLVDESGTLIGVNSFKGGGEGLNFAVAVDDVKKFLARSGNRGSARPQVSYSNVPCTVKEIARWRTKQNDATVVGFDLICKGKIDAQFVYPDSLSQPIRLEMDRNHDGKIDVNFYDFKRNGKWELSFWDGKFEGSWSLVGYHDDGRLKPTRFESYAAYRNRLAANRAVIIPEEETDDDEP